MTLRLIYDFLYTAGLVGSQRQFSREWLHRQPSYMSCCESRSKEPSLEVLLILYNRIRRLVSASPDKAEAGSQYREQLADLVAEIRIIIGRRLQSGGFGSF
jgi:hypothetical protein